MPGRGLLTRPVVATRFRPNSRPNLDEPVAQLVEHVTFNHGVSGSNPDGLTTPLIVSHRPPKAFAPCRDECERRSMYPTSGPGNARGAAE